MERKATVDWRMIGQDVQAYLKDAGENWRTTFIPMIQGVVTDRGKQLSTDFGMAFNVQNLYARDWFNKYSLTFAQPIIDTTRDELAGVLAQAQAEGWSIPESQKHITSMFEQWMSGDVDPDTFGWLQDRLPPYRTEMIARTETIRASNAGSVEIYKDWGVQQHEWLATHDDRVRDDHLAAEGQVVNVDEPFSVGGESLLFPGDPAGSPGNTINCRCTTIPVIKQGEPLQPPVEPAPEEVRAPRRFTGEEDANKWGFSQSSINPALSRDEIKSLKEYKKGHTYRSINEPLRAGDPNYPFGGEIKRIDSALSKTTLQEPVTVYRGFPTDILPNENLAGATLQDHGFMSTSLAQDTGEKFALWANESERGAGLLMIDVPEGNPGLWMERFWKSSGESELLLPRDTQIEIISDIMRDDNVRVLYGRVVR